LSELKLTRGIELLCIGLLYPVHCVLFGELLFFVLTNIKLLPLNLVLVNSVCDILGQFWQQSVQRPVLGHKWWFFCVSHRCHSNPCTSAL